MYQFTTAREAMSYATPVLEDATTDVAAAVVCGGRGKFRVAFHAEGGRARLAPGETVSATMLRDGQLV